MVLEIHINYSNSYYNFIVKVDKEFNSELSTEQVKLLELFSKEINNSKGLRKA
jgi:hypothetical protein